MTTDFSKLNILVVGDIMLDTYYIGSVDRISPEGPFPVVAVNKVTHTLGGAANVSYNISTLGARSTLVGYIGNDRWGGYISETCTKHSIKPAFVATPYTTIVKSRIIGGHQGICRMDMEDSFYDETLEAQLMETVTREIPNHQIVIISDYLKGAISSKLCQHIITTSNRLGIPLMIDPKGTDWSKYRGSYFVKPNLKELCDVYGDRVNNTTDDVALAAQAVMAKYDIGKMLITRSEKGMTFVDGNSKENVKHIHTRAQEVYDVSGAGDTVIATLACSVGVAKMGSIPNADANADTNAGSNYTHTAEVIGDAMELANHAAGVVVSKMGTTPIHIHELRKAIDAENCTNTDENRSGGNPFEGSYLPTHKSHEITDLIAALKGEGKRIVFTNGVFDILHKGHVGYLQQAANLGDVLILGLNSDASVKRLKGDSRPMNAEVDRAFVLAGLGSVGYVVVFDEDTPFDLLSKVRPHVLVKGGDYRVEDIVGREFADETVVIPFFDGYSTTNLISKIRN